MLGNGFFWYPHEDAGDHRPAWSPDGTRLAVAWGDAPSRVRVVDVRSGAVSQLGCGRLPTWWDDQRLLIELYDPDC
jgi:hypothetical protein